MSGPKIERPEPRNYGKETRDALQAQIDLAPDIYRAESRYRPLYSDLNIDILRDALFGRTAASREEDTVDTDIKGVKEKFIDMVINDGKPGNDTIDNIRNSKSLSPELSNFIDRVIRGEADIEDAPGIDSRRRRQLGEMLAPVREMAAQKSQAPTDPADMERSGGLLDMFGQVGKIQRDLQREQVSDELGIVEDYGQRATAALRGANPYVKQQLENTNNLANTMSADAMAQLQMGGALSPEDRRLAEQQAREAYSARGMGTSHSAMAAEVLNRQRFKDRRKQQAYGYANNAAQLMNQALNQEGAFTADPFQALLNRSSGATRNAAGVALTGGGVARGGPQLFNPESALAAQMNSDNFNANNAVNIGNANNQAALQGGLLGVGGLLGAALI